MIKKHSTKNNKVLSSEALVSDSALLEDDADKTYENLQEELHNVVGNGYKALVALCQWLHIPLPEAEIQQYFLTSTDSSDIEATAVIAKKIGFKVKVEPYFSKDNLNQIEKILPAILFSKEQSKWYLLLKKQNNNSWFIYPVGSQKPILLDSSAIDDLLITHVLQIKPSYKLSIQQKLLSSSWFISTIKKYKKLFFQVLVAGFFIQLFALITPLFFQVVMDKVLVHQSFSTLNVIGFAFAVVITFEAILSLLRGYLLTHTSSRIDVELGSKLFGHLIHLPLGWFEQRQTGQVVSRVKELDTLREFMTSTLLALLIDLPFLFIFLFIMALYSLPLTLLVVAVLSPLVVVAAVGLPILRKQLNQRFKHGAENQSYLVEKITSPQLFKGLRLEPLIQRGWEDRLARYAKSHFTTAITGLFMGQSAAFINKVMLLAILWYGAHLVIDNTMTVGALIAFNLFAMRVSGPILNVMQMFQQFSEAKLSIEKLTDIVETPVEVDVAYGEHHLPIKEGQIIFNNVSFSYEANNVLQQLNIDISAGEKVAIVGQSGSGKSTIAKLLQRLYLPDNGMVQLDGANLQQFSLSQLRKNIGVVNQHTELWSGTIAENIALAKPMSSTDEIIRVAHLSGAHGFITSFEKGYNHKVCEAGANLSGGQRQRLAIARVLLMQPSILVLDEATSAMDPLMEANFYDHLFQSYQNTMIIIAHRLSSIRRCDRILVMDDGKVVEQGSHDQLIAKNKLYRQMWDSQMYASSRDVDLYGEPLADRESNNTVAVGE